MTSNVYNDKERQNREKGICYPFMKILDEMIQESRKEMVKKQNDNNEQKTITKS